MGEVTYTVSFNDLTDSDVTAMEYFITETGLDLAGLSHIDMSDFNYDGADTIYEYKFTNEIDAMHFVLRFGGRVK